MQKSYLKSIIARLKLHYDTNKFYSVKTNANFSLCLFMIKKHVTFNITLRNSFEISGLCKVYSIYDSDTLFLGYLFESVKRNTKITPLMLSVIIDSDNDEEFFEVKLPPKFGILAFKSNNASAIVLAQEELDFPYIIKDVQN